MFKFGLMLSIVWVLFVGCEKKDSENIKHANLAFEKEDYKTAGNFFKKACDEEGNLEGCERYGALCYFENNINDCISYLKKACDGGLASSCDLLGIDYLEGKIVPKDSFKAFELFNVACDGGNSDGCFNLGVCYLNGEGTKQNKEEALEYFGKACEMKHEKGCEAYAQINQK